MRPAFARDRRALLAALAAMGVVGGTRASSEPATGPGIGAPAAPGPAGKKPAPRAAPTAPPENIETLAPETAVAILGKTARDSAGHAMGPVVDVLVDRYGFGRAAVIDFGGFLGVGSRKIAIDWALLTFDPDNPEAPATVLLDRAMVQAAPEYKPVAKQPLPVVGPPPAPAGAMPRGGK